MTEYDENHHSDQKWLFTQYLHVREPKFCLFGLIIACLYFESYYPLTSYFNKSMVFYGDSEHAWLMDGPVLLNSLISNRN
jgi:hypothetical protein